MATNAVVSFIIMFEASVTIYDLFYSRLLFIFGKISMSLYMIASKTFD